MATENSGNNLLSKLFSYVTDYPELQRLADAIRPPISSTYKEILTECKDGAVDISSKLKIESVVDYLHERLHIGHWSDVPTLLRQAYFASSFLKAVVLVKLDTNVETIQEVLKCIDVGILLGMPPEGNQELLTKCAKFVSLEISKSDRKTEINPIKSKKRKLERFPKYDNLSAIEISQEELPSLQGFMTRYYKLNIPVKIQGSITHWPALKKWTDVSYLLTMGGERTVPIEIGSQYSDENWSQQLMTLREFIQKYYLGDAEDIGYLAQHNLLDQIPELKEDICIPEYCVLSRDDERSSLEINAWFGPEGTISSLHFDPKDNLLAQVFGTKLVVMFAPADTPYLYLHDDHLLCNTARVDPTNANLDRFPLFSKAKMYKCLLEAGDALYIPPKWWHYVVALEKSFSVNFWWT